ncbi:exported hypothetical protein [Gammaproteobacteria bacterium]
MWRLILSTATMAVRALSSITCPHLAAVAAAGAAVVAVAGVPEARLVSFHVTQGASRPPGCF